MLYDFVEWMLFFYLLSASFALSICFKSLGRYELFQSLFHYFYVELNSAWTFIADACIRSGAIQHQDSFSLDKELHWYCWITWSLWILAVFWRHCCCLRHWVTYLLVRVKVFYGKMSHSSEWEEIWNRQHFTIRWCMPKPLHTRLFPFEANISLPYKAVSVMRLYGIHAFVVDPFMVFFCNYCFF